MLNIGFFRLPLAQPYEISKLQWPALTKIRPPTLPPPLIYEMLSFVLRLPLFSLRLIHAPVMYRNPQACSTDLYSLPLSYSSRGFVCWISLFWKSKIFTIDRKKTISSPDTLADQVSELAEQVAANADGVLVHVLLLHCLHAAQYEESFYSVKESVLVDVIVILLSVWWQ